MNCPKCGSFVEDGKTYCFMCGTKLGNSDFSSPGRIDRNPSLNEEYYKKKEEYKNRLNNYRDVKIERVKDEKRDLFDIYADYKTYIKLGIVLFIVIIGIIIAYNIAVKDNRDEVLKPVINNLYYSIDDHLKLSNQSNGLLVYNLTGSTGTSCSISVTAQPSSSGDYVNEKFEELQTNYINLLKYDEDMILENPNDVPIFHTNSFVVNGTTWNYLYVFFPSKSQNKDYTFLKYRHLSVGYKESFYDITLSNNDNDDKCNTYLDSTIRSLKFISE